jgi:hypothetical protein
MLIGAARAGAANSRVTGRRRFDAGDAQLHLEMTLLPVFIVMTQHIDADDS